MDSYKFDRLRFDKNADRVSQVALKIRGLLGKLIYLSSEQRVSSTHPRWDRHPLLYSLLQELYSFLGHIEVLCEMRLYRRGADLGPAFECLPNGSLAPCRETQCRISSTRNLHARFPWNSAVDLQLFLFGWNTAIETLPGNSCFYKQLQAQDLASAAT